MTSNRIGSSPAPSVADSASASGVVNPTPTTALTVSHADADGEIVAFASGAPNAASAVAPTAATSGTDVGLVKAADR